MTPAQQRRLHQRAAAFAAHVRISQWMKAQDDLRVAAFHQDQEALASTMPPPLGEPFTPWCGW